MKKLVCSCSQVYEEDITKFREQYPFMSPQGVLSALNVGNGCGSCLNGDCTITDISIESVIVNIEKAKSS